MWTFNAAFSAPLTGITESLQRYLFHWTKCWRNLAGHKHMEQHRNRPCGPLCLRQTLWHVQLLSSVCMWSMSLFHAWSCAYLICFQHPLLAVCSTCVCVCVWKLSHTSPLNFPHLTWKLSPRSVTFPSWKTGSDRLPCVSHIFICFCHVSPWPPTLTCQQCRFVSEWNTSSEEGSWPKIKSVSLRWCCLNRWVSSAFWGVFARDSKICVLLCLHDLFHPCPLQFIYLAMRVGNMKQKNLFWS